MTDKKRIELLENALIVYVKRYGMTDEAKDYYIRNYDCHKSQSGRMN